MNKISKLAVMTATVAGLVFVTGNPAFAAHDDSFEVSTPTPSSCFNTVIPAGVIKYVDYGEGSPGGGTNDDYLEVIDNCGNRDGVVGYAWLNGHPIGRKYNGNGAGTKVLWDPFKAYGNVFAGDVVMLQICSINGEWGTPYGCRTASRESVDG